MAVTPEIRETRKVREDSVAQIETQILLLIELGTNVCAEVRKQMLKVFKHLRQEVLHPHHRFGQLFSSVGDFVPSSSAARKPKDIVSVNHKHLNHLHISRLQAASASRAQSSVESLGKEEDVRKRSNGMSSTWVLCQLAGHRCH